MHAGLVARLEAGGRSSGEVHVGIRIPPFLASFHATARYPGYLHLAEAVLPVTGDTLVLPEGTRLVLRGHATSPIGSAVLRGPDTVDSLPSTALDLNGTVMLRRSGTWRLDVRTRSGAVLRGMPPALPVRLVPDSIPQVAIVVPGVDTMTATESSIPLVISVRDDHGVASAELEVDAPGSTKDRHVKLPVNGADDRALLPAVLDLAALHLSPGDTVRYRAVATDNAPTPHRGQSPVYLVRIPTVTEQRAAQERLTAATGAAFDSLSSAAERSLRSTEDLAAERRRTDPAAATGGDTIQHHALDNQAARTATAVAEASQRVLDRVDSIRQSVARLRDAARSESEPDTALVRRLAEVDQLLDRALTPEARATLAQLQQALRDLDANRVQSTLQDLAKQQATLRQALDRARDLFARAALETTLNNLGRTAAALDSAERQLPNPFSNGDTSAISRQQQLARQADSLAAGLERAARKVPAPSTQAGLQQAGAQAASAAQQMEQASQSARTGEHAKASGHASEAARQLQPLAQQIDKQRRTMQAAMRAEVQAALQRALEETNRLARQQQDAVASFETRPLDPATRAGQGVIEEGAAKLARQLEAIGSMNALVSPQAGVAVAEARRQMRAAIAAVAAARPDPATAIQQSGNAVQALTVAGFALLQSRDRIDGSQSGSGVAEALQQLRDMAARQQQLGQRGATMLQPGGEGGGGGLSTPALMQLAIEQRALAQQLDRLRAAGQVPGAGDLAGEAHDLAKSLAQGWLNRDVVARQQRLFKHMLDAGRTLQGTDDDVDSERRSTVAADGPLSIPPALDPRIRNGAGEIEVPSWTMLQRLSPAERRQVVEYFQRLAAGAPPPP